VSEALVRSVVFKRDDALDLSVYPFTIPAIRDLEELVLDPAVTFFIGDNGSGKSTLVEAIAIAAKLNPEGGSRFTRLATADASESPLHRRVRLVRGTRRIRDGFFLRAESFFNVATYLDQMKKDDGGAGALAPYGLMRTYWSTLAGLNKWKGGEFTSITLLADSGLSVEARAVARRVVHRAHHQPLRG